MMAEVKCQEVNDTGPSNQVMNKIINYIYDTEHCDVMVNANRCC